MCRDTSLKRVFICSKVTKKYHVFLEWPLKILLTVKFGIEEGKSNNFGPNFSVNE